MVEIKLLKSTLVALVDDEDADLVAGIAWFITRKRGRAKYRYVYTRLPGIGTISLHRFIMRAPKGMLVDHRDHNTLDNRRANLRVCTSSQNQQNAFTKKTSATGLKGVWFDARKKCYRPRIWIDGKRTWLGSFHSAEHAAEAYREAAIKHHGEFACFE